jgi:hypothetical protein
VAISETRIVNTMVHDEYSTKGQRRPPEVAAASYGEDVKKMLEAPSFFAPETIRLQARCAFRFARLALGETFAWEK